MWTGADEKVLAEFGERASVLKILHGRAAQKLQRFDKYCIIPSLILTTTSAALIAVGEAEDETVRYLAAAMSLFGGMLVAVNKHLKFSERADSHKHTSSVYGKINRHVIVELALNRGHRGKTTEVLHKIRNMTDTASDEALLINQCIVNDFMKNFTNAHKISMPDICLGLVPIFVNENEDGDAEDIHLQLQQDDSTELDTVNKRNDRIEL